MTGCRMQRVWRNLKKSKAGGLSSGPWVISKPMGSQKKQARGHAGRPGIVCRDMQNERREMRLVVLLQVTKSHLSRQQRNPHLCDTNVVVVDLQHVKANAGNRRVRQPLSAWRQSTAPDMIFALHTSAHTSQLIATVGTLMGF